MPQGHLPSLLTQGQVQLIGPGHLSPCPHNTGLSGKRTLRENKGTGWGARTPRSGVSYSLSELWFLPASLVEGLF